MKSNWKVIGETGLQFFGKMSASISHEIKNVMAIINENAGLLEDLSLMEAKGIPIDGERIRTITRRIQSQIQRGDRIIKNMNRFAHSADTPLGSLEIEDLFFLVEALSKRLATLRGVTLKLTPPMETFAFHGNLFLLEHLLWQCLDFAMELVGPGNTVEMGAIQKKQDAKIRLTWTAGLIQSECDDFPTAREEALLLALKARLDVRSGDGEMVIILPLGEERK
jgi:C4-dicarboxylate-specific signal transduction histidine kinase